MGKILALVGSLTMTISLLSLPLPAARVRKGATVEVTLADDGRVKGELLSVREDALLLYEDDSGRGRHIYLQQVTQVKVIRKSKLSEGIGIGIGIGLAISVTNLRKTDRESLIPALDVAESFLPLPVTGLCGGLLGALAGMPKKISLRGKSPEKVRTNLIWLKRHAREQNLE